MWDIPTSEVRTAMAQLYIEQLLAGKPSEQAGADRIVHRLETKRRGINRLHA